MLYTVCLLVSQTIDALCIVCVCVCVCVCVSSTQEGTFERKSLEPIDHFDGDYQREQLVGICNQCKESDVYVSS